MGIQDLISVIVPIYNVQKYLPRCIDSIVNQTYQNIEIILVDDGSPDSCPTICDEYKNRDNRIKVIHKQNGGLSEARNAGIELAVGNFIAFVDSDDYVAADYLERMYSSLINNHADMVICDFKNVDENGHGLYIGVSPIKDEILSSDELIYKYNDINGYYYVVAWNKLYKKEVINDIRFPKGKIHEDEYTCHLFARNCKKIATIADKLYFYVRRDSGIMGCEKNLLTIKQIDGCEALGERILFQYKNGLTKNINELFGVYYFQYERLRRKLVKNNRNRIKEMDRQLKEVSETCYRTLSMKNRIKASFPIYYYYLNAVNNKYKSINIPHPLVQKKDAERWKADLNSFNKSKVSSNRIFLLDTPIHGNIGDQAIVVAERRLLKEKYPNKEIIEVLHPDLKFCMEEISNSMNLDDIVYVHGGGFIGSLWSNEHKVLVNVLKRFKNNRIIIFPQTVFFYKEDNKLLADFIVTVNECSDLTILLRDKQSFDLLKRSGAKCKLIYTPDVVLSLPYENNSNRNKKVLLCFRSDLEKKSDYGYIPKLLDDNKIDYDFTDTVIDRTVNRTDSEYEVYKKLEEFASYDLVICDRLHGMIFSIITKTPCIAFDNVSKKVSGVYEWVKDCEYVKCLTDDLDIQLVNQMRELHVNRYDNEIFAKQIEKFL